MKRKRHMNYDKRDYDALMNSTIPASFAGSEKRFDSDEDTSIFFARELDFIKSQSYDVEYPELTALSTFPVSDDINPGAESHTYYSYDKTGMAKIISNYATDLPRADVKGKPTTAYIKSLGASYGYSAQEMRASRYSGKSLDARKAESARYQIDYLNNKIAWAGDEENNLVGVLTPSNDIPLFILPTGAGGGTSWASKTPQEIMADINGMQKQVAAATKNVEKPDTLAMPADVYIDISTRQIEATGYTVKRFIMENAPYIKDIISASELQRDSVDTNPYGENVALLFTNDKRKIAIEIPMPFYQYPVQPRNLEMVIPCEARTAGVSIYYPLSLLIAVGV